MKKILTLFVTLFALVFSCVAQEENCTHFFKPKFGIRAGYNLTNVTKIMDLNPNSPIVPHWKSAANFGFVTDFHSKGTFVLRSGLSYSLKGYNESIRYIEDSTVVRKFNYLEIPLLAVWQYPISKNISWEFQMGFYTAYGICGKTKEYVSESKCYKMSTNTEVGNDENLFGSDVYTKKETIESDYITFDHYKRFDWGANIGFGINIYELYFGVAYELGAVELRKSSTNHCISVNLGYNF